MDNFIIVYIIIAATFLIHDFVRPNSKTPLLLLLFIAAISSTIVGLRPLSAGYDTITYVAYYESITSETFTEFKELYAYNFENDYLYRFWNFIINSFGADSQDFLYITAFVSIFLFLVAIQKVFKQNSLLIFLFFFSSPAFISLFGNAIRQGLAIPFYLFAIYYFFEKKKYQMIVSVLLALFFHNYTGIILILILIFLKLFYNLIVKYKYIVFILMLVIEPISYYLSGFIYSIYSVEYFTFIGFDYLFHYSLLLFLYLYFIYCFRVKRISDDNRNKFATYTIITFITSFLWFNKDSFGRILYLGFPFLCYFLSNLAVLYKQKWILALIVVIMFFVGIYFFTSESAVETLSNNF